MPSKRCSKPGWNHRQQGRCEICVVGDSATRRGAGIACAWVVFLCWLPGVTVGADVLPRLPAGVLLSQAMADSAKSPEEVEYQVKAAFIYNFMKFTEWPAEKMETNGSEKSSVPPMLIGIVGENPFGKAFEPLMDKKIKDRPLKLVFVPGMVAYARKYSDRQQAADQYWQEQGQTLQACHVLFYCNSEKSWLAEHLRQTQQYPVLTVGEAEGFLNLKGIICFVKDENKIRFEIHLTQAERQGLKISSQLLKLARRVIQEKESNGK